MKNFGIFLLIIGVIAALVSFNMNVSVETGYGNRVNNIGLMSDRQNYLIASCVAILCGLIMAVFGNKKVNGEQVVKCPFCAEQISSEAIKCKHCGSDVNASNKAIQGDAQSSDDENIKLLLDYFNDEYEINDNKIKEIADSMIATHPKKTRDEIEVMYMVDIEDMSSSLSAEMKKKFKERYLYWLHDN